MLTVVIPNLNSNLLWKRTLSGIIKNKEYIKHIIIVDGYSSDNSGIELSKELAKCNISSEILYAEPRGIIDAIRYGISHVKTDYVLINLSGDELISIPNIKEDNKVGIYYGACEIYNKESKKIGLFYELNPKVSKYRMPHINMNSIIWPMNFMKSSEALLKDYKIASDHAILLEALNKGIDFMFVPELSAIFYKDGISSNNEMYSFGLGEGFYITLNYGAVLKACAYNIYNLIFRRIRFNQFIHGFKFAKGINK